MRVGKGALAPCPPPLSLSAVVGTLRFAHPTIYTTCLRLVSRPSEQALLNVCQRSCPEPERSSRARRTIQRLAVRAGESDCRAAEEESKGRGAVRDRLWPVGPAAYRHLR